jgi:hypothetical protein
MRNPLAVLAPRRFGSADQSVPASRRVPAPDALPGVEFLEHGCAGEGDSVAGRCRVDLGRARLTITPLLTGSERLARRLAEARARPRDRAVRRCLEHALAVELTSVGLTDLISLHPGAPACDVPVR